MDHAEMVRKQKRKEREDCIKKQHEPGGCEENCPRFGKGECLLSKRPVIPRRY